MPREGKGNNAQGLELRRLKPGTPIDSFEKLEKAARRAASAFATPTNSIPDARIWESVDEFLSWPSHPAFSEPESGGMSALHFAAQFGRLSVMEKLVEDEDILLDMEAETDTGLTPLHLASIAGHHEIIKLLNKYKDQQRGFVNKRDHQCPTRGKHRELNSRTILPSFTRSFKVTRSYVHRRYSKLEPTPETNLTKNVHRTALHYAAEHGHFSAVKAILEFPELDMNARDCDGETPLHLAIMNRASQNLKPPWWNQDVTNHLEIIKMVVELPRMNVNVESGGPDADTPLHTCVRMQDPEVAELLCKHSRILAMKMNKKRMTPLCLAWNQHHQSDLLENVKGILLRRVDVQRYVDELRQERGVHHTEVNALLVGGTLLASLTFAGILEMPTLPAQNYSSASLSSPSPATSVDPRFIWYVRVIDTFRGSNNITFFLSIITVLLAIQVPIARRHTTFIEQEVDRLRTWIVLISFCLTLSTTCAAIAFVSGGLAKVPMSESGWSLLLSTWSGGEWMVPFKSTMITTSLAGLSVLLIILVQNFIYDYVVMVRRYFDSKFSISSFLALNLSVLLLSIVLGVLLLLVFGSGLLNHNDVI